MTGSAVRSAAAEHLSAALLVARPSDVSAQDGVITSGPLPVVSDYSLSLLDSAARGQGTQPSDDSQAVLQALLMRRGSAASSSSASSSSASLPRTPASLLESSAQGAETGSSTAGAAAAAAPASCASAPRSSSEGGASTSIFFARVPPTVPYEDIEALFQTFGKVVSLNLFRPWASAKTSKGCGIVEFDATASAVAAMATLHNQYRWTAAETAMVCEWTDPSRHRKEQANAKGVFEAKHKTNQSGRSRSRHAATRSLMPLGAQAAPAYGAGRMPATGRGVGALMPQLDLAASRAAGAGLPEWWQSLAYSGFATAAPIHGLAQMALQQQQQQMMMMAQPSLGHLLPAVAPDYAAVAAGMCDGFSAPAPTAGLQQPTFASDVDASHYQQQLLALSAHLAASGTLPGASMGMPGVAFGAAFGGASTGTSPAVLSELAASCTPVACEPLVFPGSTGAHYGAAHMGLMHHSMHGGSTWSLPALHHSGSLPALQHSDSLPLPLGFLQAEGCAAAVAGGGGLPAAAGYASSRSDSCLAALQLPLEADMWAPAFGGAMQCTGLAGSGF